MLRQLKYVGLVILNSNPATDCFEVDGEDGEATHGSIDTTVELTDLLRGQHTLTATVVAAAGV